MNSTNLQLKNEKASIDYVGLLGIVVPRDNGNHAGIDALSQSLKRGKQLVLDAYLDLPVRQSNHFKAKESEQNSFERISEQIGACHA